MLVIVPSSTNTTPRKPEKEYGGRKEGRNEGTKERTNEDGGKKCIKECLKEESKDGRMDERKEGRKLRKDGLNTKGRDGNTEGGEMGRRDKIQMKKTRWEYGKGVKWEGEIRYT